ncbi:DUF2946 domain-containing protein [Roseateles terrae]|uniref:DUF2946 domain-containing protein n=1 Tax=Roseateles terrae TaxID=431060 RepID=A0ABR6GLA3_9BURK|nr:DUF2946 domain-containing protein [Roseateles terrae]MBB3192889.1 hypothetical protein [Roseateles terrae]OWQ89853.1 hypothetical protein CDN98_04950 [Roseateles terrae]
MLASRVLVARLAWIVSFTLLMSAWMPSLAHVFVTPKAGEFVEICSATGTIFMRLQAEPGMETKTGTETKANKDVDDTEASSHPSPSADASSSMNCPCCSLHHGAPSLPPSELQWTPPDALRFERPTLFLQAPRLLFAWAPALARGPPDLS